MADLRKCQRKPTSKGYIPSREVKKLYFVFLTAGAGICVEPSGEGEGRDQAEAVQRKIG